MSPAREWINRRRDGVPPALANHLRAFAKGDLTTAAVDMLARALSHEPMTRAQALDVLGADALVTYAFESAADDPATLGARADAAMLSVAQLAESRS